MTYRKKYFIEPSYTYIFTVLTLPQTFLPKTQTDMKEVILPIPGCWDPVIFNTTYCLKQHQLDREEEAFEQKIETKRREAREKKKKRLHTYGNLNAKTSREKQASKQPEEFRFDHQSNRLHKYLQGRSSNLLVLVKSDEKSLYLEASNILASMLRPQCAFLLWETSRVTDLSLWVVEQLEQCARVLVLCTPQGKAAFENKSSPAVAGDGFVEGLNAVKHDRKIAVVTVYFDESDVNVPEFLKNRGKCFKLDEDLKKFLKYTDASVSAEKSNLLKQKIKRIRSNGFGSTCSAEEWLRIQNCDMKASRRGDVQVVSCSEA